MKTPSASRVLHLPFGLSIIIYPSGDGALVGSLLAQLQDAGDSPNDKAPAAAAAAMESLLLALACEGCELEAPRLKAAIETAVEAVANKL
jgi:hypothetical protein